MNKINYMTDQPTLISSMKSFGRIFTLIRTRKTGNKEQFARKIGVTPSQVDIIIQSIENYGKKVRYCDTHGYSFTDQDQLDTLDHTSVP